MFSVILLLAALAGACLTIILRKQAGIRRVQTLIAWLMGCCIGLGGLWAFVGHAFFAQRVAESIGWAPSPFQWEIAMANLACGILGIFSVFMTGRFRLATAIFVNVYLLGCAIGHFHQIITEHNVSINNAGPILWVGDIAVPLLVLVTVLIAEGKRRTDQA